MHFLDGFAQDDYEATSLELVATNRDHPSYRIYVKNFP